MPYSYGKHNLRRSVRVSAQWREPQPALSVPQRAERAASKPLAPAPERKVRRQEPLSSRMNIQMVSGIALIILSLALIFHKVPLSNPLPVLRLLPASQAVQSPQKVRAHHTIPVRLSFPVEEISSDVTALAQADKRHYNNENPEWSQWSNSACSGCAMAALMDAYGATIHGRPLNCGDVLETELRLSVYNPVNSWGLVTGEPDELVKTAEQFGFTGHYSQQLSLDDLIALANAGVPSIVRIPSHVMVLTGGDSQYVYLADSGGLHLSKVTRSQFLNGLPGSRLYAGQSWMEGWYVILTPNKNNT